MWEQHERSNETEISPDAAQKLAEDTTYKVWELVNVCLINFFLTIFKQNFFAEHQNIRHKIEWTCHR